MFRNTKNKIAPILYTFLLIFNPPFLPISTIYIVGPLSLIYLLANKKYASAIKLFEKTKIKKLILPLLAISALSLIAMAIDAIFIDGRLFFDDSLKVLSRATIITMFEITFALNLIIIAKKRNKGFKYIIRLLIIAGLIQGLLALISYISPTIRSLFLANSSFSNNEYYLERRGYGYASTLLDTFGYGMGLLAGICILTKDNKLKIYTKTIAILLILLSITLNSRTGIIIFAIAVIIYIIRLENIISIFKAIFGVLIIMFFATQLLPNITQQMQKSGNSNQVWIANSIEEIYSLANGNAKVDDMNFLSNTHSVPNNSFELLFGTGHSVYGLKKTIGFHSDVGYINYIWQYGIFGTLALLFTYFYIFQIARKSVREKFQASIIVFLMIAFYIANIKAILIGSNPGIIITYIIVFSTIYYGKETNELKENHA